MGRKDKLSYVLLNGVDASVNQTSSNTNIEYLDKVGLVIQWTGSPVGNLFVDVNVQVQSSSGVSNSSFAPLSFQDAASSSVVSSIPIPGSGSPLIIKLSDLCFSQIRVRYVATSGTGNLTVYLDSKVVGS